MISSSKTKKQLNGHNTTYHTAPPHTHTAPPHTHTAPPHTHTAPHHTHTAPHHIMTHHLHDTHNETSVLGKALHFVIGAFAVLAFVLAILAIGGFINYNDVPISAIDGKLIENTSKTDSNVLVNYEDSFELSTTSSSADLLLENKNNKLNISTDIQLTSGTSAKPQLTVAPGGVFLESPLDMGGQNIVDVNQMTINSIVPQLMGSLTTTEIKANKFILNRITTPPTGTVGDVGDVRLMLTNGSASFTGSITTTTLTVTGVGSGTLYVGMTVTGPGVLVDTIITSGSGTTYTVNKSQSIPTEITMSGISTNRLYVNSASNVWNYLPLYTDGVGNTERGSLLVKTTKDVDSKFEDFYQPANTIIESLYFTSRGDMTTSSTGYLCFRLGTSSTGAQIINAYNGSTPLSYILDKSTTLKSNSPLPIIENANASVNLAKYHGVTPGSNTTVSFNTSSFTSLKRRLYITLTPVDHDLSSTAYTIDIVIKYKSIS